MKTNKIGYLGFIGLTGLLGLYNIPLFSLFTFCILFIFLKNDERMEKNIGVATRNAFIYYVLLSTLLLGSINITKTHDLLPLFTALLIQGITVFSLSYTYYNKKGE